MKQKMEDERRLQRRVYRKQQIAKRGEQKEEASNEKRATKR